MFEKIAFSTFRDRTGIDLSRLSHAWADVRSVVSLRDATTIESLQVMPREYLGRLLDSVCLQGDPAKKVYVGSTFRTVHVDPNHLMIGQSFVERGKYQAFLESFEHVFDGFCTSRGVAKCTALIALCRLADGSRAIAHYVPPIIEEHGGKLCLVDGIHRNFLVRTIGATIEAVVVQGVTCPLPYDPQSWERVQVVAEKPAKDKRFFNLQPELFRDLKFTGIDG